MRITHVKKPNIICQTSALTMLSKKPNEYQNITLKIV